jgi:hypothetical protein
MQILNSYLKSDFGYHTSVTRPEHFLELTELQHVTS